MRNKANETKYEMKDGRESASAVLVQNCQENRFMLRQKSHLLRLKCSKKRGNYAQLTRVCLVSSSFPKQKEGSLFLGLRGRICSSARRGSSVGVKASWPLSDARKFQRRAKTMPRAVIEPSSSSRAFQHS